MPGSPSCGVHRLPENFEKKTGDLAGSQHLDRKAIERIRALG